jgi:hypothetical protein
MCTVQSDSALSAYNIEIGTLLKKSKLTELAHSGVAVFLLLLLFLVEQLQMVLAVSLVQQQGLSRGWISTKTS